MKRVAAVVLLLTLAACSQAPRPEGQVERWLRSLNQGAAGAPGELAPDELSEIVVPGWAEREPETIDRIEVAAALADGERWAVPFVVMELDGRTFRGVATVDPLAAVPIVGVEGAGPFATASADHGNTTAADWAGALLLGLVIAALSLALVGVVRRRAATTTA